MSSTEDPDHSTLGRAVESIFRRIESGGKAVLLVIDEMPELLLALGRDEDGTERVSRLLHWLRALRQTYRQNVRWILLGSIGLDSFVDDRNLRKAINDLTPLNLDALTTEEAARFLSQLGESNGLPLSAEQRALIIDRVGWPLPHHLQIVFHALIDSGATEADAAAVHVAFAHLLLPHNLSQFDTWRQRLDEQFGQSDATAAKDILRHLCQHAGGRERAPGLERADDHSSDRRSCRCRGPTRPPAAHAPARWLPAGERGPLRVSFVPAPRILAPPRMPMTPTAPTVLLSLHQLSLYNPGRMSPEQIIAAFAARRQQLDRIVADLATEMPKSRGQLTGGNPRTALTLFFRL